MATEAENNHEVKREFKLTNFSVSNRTSVLILTAIIVFAGWNAYTTMPKESFPEIVFPLVYIGTPYPGNSPVDIENLITRPIEKELKNINGVKVIRSTSVQDYSTINVEFNPEIDVEVAVQDVKDAVDRAQSNLPSDLDADPNVFEVDLSELPIMFINLSGDYSLQELKVFAEYLQDEIEGLPQISKAEIRGALEREIRIDADPYRMEAMQVSFGDIIQAVQNENITQSGGDILMDDFRRSLRVVGEFENVSQLLVSSESLQFAFILMVAGIIGIVLGYGKFSGWVKSQKIYYARPHLARFIRRAILPVFAIALITSTNAYMQTSGVFEQDVGGDGDLSAEATFAKILNTFNILVIGYTVSHLIPIALTKREKSTLEKEDFDAWFDQRGFSDDDGDLFHKLYKWVPPKMGPEEIPEEEFNKHLQSKEGLEYLEQFRTTKGNPIGGYEKLIKEPFEEWKKSERAKIRKVLQKLYHRK